MGTSERASGGARGVALAERIPEQIVKTLERAIRRLRSVIVIRGACAVAAVLLAAVLLAMGMDAAAVILSSTTRWAVSLAVLGVTLLAALWFLVRPLAHSYTLRGVARMVEDNHPELEERISSSVELLGSTDAAAVRGSESLIAELAREAVADARVLIPAQEFTLREARPFIVAASAALAVMVLLFGLWPTQAWRLFVPIVKPGANIENMLASGRLSVNPDRDVTLMKGSSFQIEATVSRGSARKAELLRSVPGGTEAAEPMERVTGNSDRQEHFRFAIPAVQESFRYRVHLGDGALSRHYQVTVVPPPAVEQIDLMYKYPAYTGRETKREENAAGDITALAGTRVTVEVLLNKPVASASMAVNGVERPAADIRTDGDRTRCTWVLPIEKGLSGEWSVALQDEHGFGNAPVSHKIRSLSDEKPTVEILIPMGDRIRLAPGGRMWVDFAAKDDFGISAAQLIAAWEAGPEAARSTYALAAGPLTVSPVEERTWLGRIYLDLSKLDLRGAAQVRVHVGVKDTLPLELAGPQEAESREIVIDIDQNAPSPERQIGQESEDLVRKALIEILAELKEAKARSGNLDKAVAKDGPLPAAAAELTDAIRKHTGNADTLLRRIADKVVNTPHAVMAQPIFAVAEDHVVPARQEAELTRLADAAAMRVGHAKLCDKHVDNAIAAVQKLLGELPDVTKRFIEKEGRLDLADREQGLANTATDQANDKGEQTPLDPNWLGDQNNVKDDISKAMNKDDRDAFQKLVERRAAELAEEAGRLARLQRDLELEDEMTRPQKQAELARDTTNLSHDVDDFRNLTNNSPTSSPEDKDHANKASDRVNDAQRGANDAAHDMQPAKQPPNNGDKTGKKPDGNNEPQPPDQQPPNSGDKTGKKPDGNNEPQPPDQQPPNNGDKTGKKPDGNNGPQPPDQQPPNNGDKTGKKPDDQNPGDNNQNQPGSTGDKQQQVAKALDDAARELGQIAKGEPSGQPDGNQPPDDQADGSKPDDGQKPGDQADGSKPGDGQKPGDQADGSKPGDGQKPGDQPNGSKPGDGQKPGSGGSPSDKMAQALKDAMGAGHASGAGKGGKLAKAAADALRKASGEGGMPMPGMTPRPGYAGGKKPGGSMMRSLAENIRLRALGRGDASENWLLLSSKLRDDIRTAMEQRTPAEYRDLAMRYFLELAERGGREARER